MKIIYKYNPLKTIVEIEERERTYLVNGILADDLTDYVADLKPFFEKDEKDESYEKIKKEISDFTFIDRLTERAEKRAESFEAALKSHHVGDCICVPCSCEKCLCRPQSPPPFAFWQTDQWPWPCRQRRRLFQRS